MQQACEREPRFGRVRALALDFSAEELDRCLQQQIDTAGNECMVCTDSTQSLDLLARAAYVRNGVEETGITLTGALRELGRRMRRVHQWAEQGEPNREIRVSGECKP